MLGSKFHLSILLKLGIFLLCCNWVIAEYEDSYFLLDNSNLQCNSTLDTKNSWEHFLKGCFIDTSKYNILGSAGAQLLEWFNQMLYFQYITSFLFFLPFVAFTEKMALETQAKANFWRLQLVLLLFRLGLAASSASWLQAMFQQSRPCTCSLNGESQILGSMYGMPSADMLVTTVLALHFFQYISKIFALLIVFAVAFEHVILGYSSVGQVLGGFVIGIFLHIYQICSPIFMRVIDFIINLIGGMLVFILVSPNVKNGDFSFAVLYLNGMAWMGFAMCLFLLFYTFKLIKIIWNTPSHFIKDDVFIYYTPLSEGSIRSISFSPQRKFENVWFILLVVLLYCVLVLFRVLTPYINQFLSLFS